MKSKLLLSVLLMTFISSYSQEIIKEANLSLTLPNDKWKFFKNQEANGLKVYFYNRVPVQDSTGRNAIPNISVVIEGLDKKLDAVTYSIMKRSQAKFKVEKMFMQKDGIIDLKNAVGYKGTYMDKFGEHTIYVIHAVNNDKGIQVIFDVLTTFFDKLDPEFKVTLKSLKCD